MMMMMLMLMIDCLLGPEHRAWQPLSRLSVYIQSHYYDNYN